MNHECLNCGHKQVYSQMYYDDLGIYMVCEDCKSSFDIKEEEY